MKYLIAFFVFTLAISTASFAEPTTAVGTGDTLPDSPMRGLTGADSSLGAYRNKPLLINVWASYCSPCLAEMASLEKLHRLFGDSINFVGISIDDYPERAQLFLQKTSTSFPHYIDRALQLENLLGAHTIPLTVLIDAQGKVLYRVQGARDWASPLTVNAVAGTFGLPSPRGKSDDQ